jgi:hypothetical protein
MENNDIIKAAGWFKRVGERVLQDQGSLGADIIVSRAAELEVDANLTFDVDELLRIIDKLATEIVEVGEEELFSGISHAGLDDDLQSLVNWIEYKISFIEGD